MAYLHEEREVFFNAVNLASVREAILPTVVEKDYYVTMILRRLSEKLGFIVFKGGTSLSKCHKVIKRFSEDIDITIDEKLSQGQMRSLKHTIMEIAQDLGLMISNIDETRSRRSYNQYILEFNSVLSEVNDIIPAQVLLETSFAEISYPTVILPVNSYIGDMMKTEAPDLRESYKLEPFEMKVQALDRTLVDKVFAICDYYLDGNVSKHSRHIYDVFKLLQIVPQTEVFKALVTKVREERAKSRRCPSAKPEVDMPELLRMIVDSNAYKRDYDDLTSRLLEEPLDYDTAVSALRTIASSGMFVNP